MTTREVLEKRLAVLQQVLDLTPSPESGPQDLATIRELIAKRQKLLDALPIIPHGQLATLDNGVEGEIHRQCRQMTDEIYRRDAALLQTLELARGRVRGLIQQVQGKTTRPAALFKRTA